MVMRDALYEAEKAEREAIREVKLLEHIFTLAQRKVKGHIGIWEWDVEKQVPHGYEKLAWKELYKFEMAGFEFVFRLCEHTDLKRDKWHVVLKGTQIIYGENNNDSDPEYMARNYMRAMDKKFKSEEAARKYIKEMQELVLADHKEEIDRQIALAKTIKDLQIW